ncbi:uncharacterized protein LOC119986845 [Tripterygium wilfordii]|uniref:uncharacterized protein LOC119986845 n=1 Tax=Tripterygium wilfordii TaxID=458696 RepID=UPI0018F83036|nr:uncharacterized protein LOC119986845 [Tripterygium wilfordii]
MDGGVEVRQDLCNKKICSQLAAVSLPLLNQGISGDIVVKKSKNSDIASSMFFPLEPPSSMLTVTERRTIYKEKYDCVDFYKQPAFDHHALKNHNFHPEMRMSQDPKGRIYEDSLTTQESFTNIWKNGKGCPTGTVPIKRKTKDDLIKIRMATEIYDESYKPLTIQEPGTHYAILYTNPSTGKKFNGGGFETTVYNPQPVTGSQYSSSQIKITNGGDSIEVGWTSLN